jgi:hypothetical protein
VENSAWEDEQVIQYLPDSVEKEGGGKRGIYSSYCLDFDCDVHKQGMSERA